LVPGIHHLVEIQEGKVRLKHGCHHGGGTTRPPQALFRGLREVPILGHIPITANLALFVYIVARPHSLILENVLLFIVVPVFVHFGPDQVPRSFLDGLGQLFDLTVADLLQEVVEGLNIVDKRLKRKFHR